MTAKRVMFASGVSSRRTYQMSNEKAFRCTPLEKQWAMSIDITCSAATQQC